MSTNDKITRNNAVNNFATACIELRVYVAASCRNRL